ncbi:cation channel sperm-associated protein 4-like isoform X2 [Triplophysa dalaica]|uniref:cation channel sperm-associated protein 4-like isoform X2 n=1 Tax=Triplophysa dalaica TaxID=1582913 RepID=UPI0024DFC414|nr:cation channel sperm-associated protein 4-like isoform X2 [Triplophysa dalaica]
MVDRKQSRDDFDNDYGRESFDLFLCFLTTTCAVSNFIIILVQMFAGLSEAFALFVSEQIILTVFILEILVKWNNGFKMFWRSWWNIVGFVITLTLIVGNRITSNPITQIICKVLRMVRINICLAFSQEAMAIVQVIGDFIKDTFMILFPFLVFMLGFATFGVHYFSSVPSAFGNLESAFYTLFICVTEDGWLEIYNKFKEDRFTSLLYFMIFISCGIFVIAMIEVLFMNNLTKLWPDVWLKDSLADSEDRPHLSAIFKDQSHVDQKFLETWYPKNLTPETYDDIVRVMLEKDLKEPYEIQRELEGILEEVLNNPANNMQDYGPKNNNFTLEETIIEEELATGDILTALLHLDQANLLDTRTTTPNLNEGVALHLGVSWEAYGV